MNLTHPKSLVLVGGVLAAVLAVTAVLTVEGTAGYVLAAAAALLFALGLVALELLRIHRLQVRQARRLDGVLAEIHQAVRNIRSRQIGLEEQVRQHVDAIREIQESIGAEFAALLEEQDRSRSETLAALDRIEEGERETACRVEAVGTDLRERDEAATVNVQTEARRQYSKVQDLLALYRDIDPERALPPMHSWAAGVDLVRHLYTQVADLGRTSVLECGSGTSTVLLAYAVRQFGKGRVVALEHDPHYAKATRRMLRERGLEDWAEVIDAPLVEVELPAGVWRWYELEAMPEGGFDLVLVDGPPGKTGPQARYPALPLLADRLAPDGELVLDDALRPEERATVERWVEELPQFRVEWLNHERGTAVLRRRDDG